MSSSKPPWMARAERAVRALRTSTVKQVGARHSVYVVLLGNAARRDPWGLYVGQLSLDLDV